MTKQVTSGRPIVKPNRKMTGFGINSNLPDKMQQLMIKWGEQSLNDTYNRMILETLKREGIK
jgi:hypothetical protein